MEGKAVCVEELDQTAHFCVVLLLGATRKARSKAHFHFRVDAAGERRIAADLDLASSYFEKVQHLFGECLRRAARRKRPVVGPGSRLALFIDDNAASNKAARVRVAQIDLQYGSGSKAHQLPVALRENLFRIVVESQGLFEGRPGFPIADQMCELAEVQALTCWIEWPKQALQAASQICRTNQIRLGSLFLGGDQANGGLGGQERKKIPRR